MVHVASVLEFLILSSVMFKECLCHPDGAPSLQCERMMPNHGSAAQTVQSPYEVQVEKPYYTPGSNVKLSIRSSTDNIKGFLIQARPAGADSVTGMFPNLPEDTKHVACGNSKGAITHSKRLAVKTIDFEWQPSPDLSGNISFFATVVKDTATFWVKLQSQELYKKENPSTPTANNTCKQDDPRCDGAQLHHDLLFLFIVSLLAFLQNVL